MDTFAMAQKAYGQTAAPLRSARGAEYEVLARATRRLHAAAASRQANFGAFADALNRNLQIWTMFAVSVADPDNALPQDLRARLFYLSEFTASETRKLLRGEGDAAALVEINTAVLRGLGAQAETSTEPAA